MRQVLLTLDTVIRFSSVAVLLLLGFPILALVCIMGTDTGTAGTNAVSACAFVVGMGVIIGLGNLSLKPQRLEAWIPGPTLLGKVIVRIPAYILGTAGMSLLLLQIWYVAIYEMFN